MNESERRTPETLRIYGVVLGVGVCCSLAIVTTYELTRPIIQRNKISLRQSAIFKVIPSAATITTYRFDHSNDQFESTSPDAEGHGAGGIGLVFAGFDRDGQLAGLAMEAQGMGYQDTIRLLYAYSFDKQAIIGIRVLESRETPGLGDRIESDPDFLGNFVHLDVTLNPEGMGLANPIEFVKPGKKTAAWQIDGITGATISSRATATMLRESASYWIPRVHSRRSAFVAREGEN